ncbi:hypothetical protein VaNZ11_005559 [Volvox africanus]|uniref:Uncharacterized protein n=1 Tax=Volvox africanus TaxID=51714 RepID=A0ABQ5RZ62_9CHLO|nr:hypothetical protein VaNZ11_005559 [Volvox africanus]
MVTPSAMLQLPQPHALALVFGGLFLGRKKPQKKSLLEEQNISFHPQLSQWAERGMENVSLATDELPPFPTANHEVQDAVSMRCSVEEHYELPDNLRGTSTSDAAGQRDILRVEHPYLPVPSGRGPIVLLSPLSRTEDDQPLSASSDCSSADGSGSPSTRKNSFFSLANGVRNLNDSSTSASSSRSESACGSTEDTATSVEAADGSDFPDVLELSTCCARAVEASQPVEMPNQLLLAAQPQPQRMDSMEMSSKRPSPVSVLHASSSAISAARANLEQSQAGSLVSPSLLLLQDVRLCGAACEHKCEDALDDAIGAGGGSEGRLVMSRSSSLALSFADYVHHDSLVESDLLLGEHQSATDGQDTSTGRMQQQQQQYKLGQTAVGHYEAVGTNPLDDTFSFAPVRALELLSNAENSACDAYIRTCDVEVTAYPGAGCDWGARGCTKPTSCRFDPLSCSGLPAFNATLLQAEVTSESTGFECVRWAESLLSAPSGTEVQRQGQQSGPLITSNSRQGSNSVPKTLISPAAEPQGDGNGASTSCPMPACITKTSGAVDITTVDSTLQLLKHLRGSLLAAGISRHQVHKTSIESSDGGANGSGLGLELQSEQAKALGAPDEISQSLVEAAQKLVGLGLLPGPLSSGNQQPPVKSAQSLHSTVPAAELSGEAACSSALMVEVAVQDTTFGKHVSAGGAAAATEYHCEQGAAGAAGRHDSSSCSAPAQVPNGEPEPCRAQTSRPRRRTALLKRMQAEWAIVQERVGAMVDDYSALAKCVAAAVSKQLALQRHCSALEKGKALVARQIQQERKQREALERQVEQQRAQQEALTLQLERERDARELLERQMQQEREQREGLMKQLERASAREQALCAGTATLQLELDEMLLCLGQESTKVALLAEALRVAGGDPDTLIEQVESEFAVKEVGPL